MMEIQYDFCAVCGDDFVSYTKNGPDSLCNYDMSPRYPYMC